MDSFKDRLKKALTAKGISQAELARRTGIGRNSISDYMKGKYEAKQENTMLIARELDVSESWLMAADVKLNAENDNPEVILLNTYKKLTHDRKKNVLQFAESQLREQKNNIVPLNAHLNDDTLAAHAADSEKIFTEEEIQGIHDYLDELDAKYDEKHKK